MDGRREINEERRELAFLITEGEGEEVAGRLRFFEKQIKGQGTMDTLDFV